MSHIIITIIISEISVQWIIIIGASFTLEQKLLMNNKSQPTFVIIYLIIVILVVDISAGVKLGCLHALTGSTVGQSLPVPLF